MREGESQSSNTKGWLNLILAVLNSRWVEVVLEGWKVAQTLWNGRAHEGMYEVLEHEATLELLDDQGEHALVRKRQKVRYLQNSILAYQDQAWGDGEILLNYKCSPGVAVDHYRPGQKTYILISLREVKNRGDQDEFNIQWETRHGFTRPTELWSADVSHPTRYLKLQVIFPTNRPPLQISLIENTTQKVTALEPKAVRRLLDGRYEVVWETDKPRLYETYSLKWEW